MRLASIVAAAFGLGGLVAILLLSGPPLRGVGREPATPTQPVWIETKWPFLGDEWGEGKAFQCKAENCGVEIDLYIRPKIGFCSSTTGVADDAELERLSDFDFMNGAAVALGDGHGINIAWMKGRIRAYTIVRPSRLRTSAITVAVNNNSDALVATAVVYDAEPVAVEPVVIEFLNGQTIQRWITHALGVA
jgi:hypothetical protein